MAPRGELFNIKLMRKSTRGCAFKEPENVQHFSSQNRPYLQLSQLQAYTEYEVCVYAFNEGGEGEKCQIFETLPDRAPAPVEALISYPSSSSISLQWRKPCPPMAFISGYRVTVSRALNYVKTSECMNNEALFCHTITGLQPAQMYNIEVQSCAADSYSNCSAARATIVMTGRAAPDVPNLSIVPDVTSASLAWTAPRGEFFNVTLVNKTRRGCSNTKPETVQLFLNMSGHDWQLTQLQSYTEYEVCVYAYNEGGDSKKCEVFETLPDRAPGPVENLTFSTTSTSISLRWKKPCPPRAVISGYRVTGAGKYQFTQKSGCAHNENHFCHTISGLQPERTYRIEVQSCAADSYYACSAAEATSVTTRPPGHVELSTEGSRVDIVDHARPQEIPNIHFGLSAVDGSQSRCDAPLCPCTVSGMEHVCLPCHELLDVRSTCEKLMSDEPLCSVEKTIGVGISVASCGGEGLPMNFGSFERTSRCDKKKVPVLTVIVADCWGSATLALRCHSDGLWGLYGEAVANATEPRTPYVCQPRHLNSPICGRRPRYRSTGGSRLGLNEFYNQRNLFPWVLGLKKRERYECSATLISESWLLTAAHCVVRSQESRNQTVDVRDLRVQRATANHNDRYVARVVLHPDYKPGTRTTNPLNDIALVRLDNPLTFSEEMYPACIDLYGEGILSESSVLAFSRANGEKQHKYDVVLQQLDMNCEFTAPWCKFPAIEETQFCGLALENKHQLVGGSSGGPCMQNLGPDSAESWAVSGVVSAAKIIPGCSQTAIIYTAVSQFREWIENVVDDGS
ncbi:uncharacterized protein LOC108664796 [Hyalella azteca]|uniref:Uncharacterized protein LOC108664796 n=1 Tax=Hyalella azteca TaxID=294128 RepID=A0A8B7N0E5_HYAAZ|nr:uncharacterized protein LOC108664796 [Hyalella azteca]